MRVHARTSEFHGKSTYLFVHVSEQSKTASRQNVRGADVEKRRGESKQIQSVNKRFGYVFEYMTPPLFENHSARLILRSLNVYEKVSELSKTPPSALLRSFSTKQTSILIIKSSHVLWTHRNTRWNNSCLWHAVACVGGLFFKYFKQDFELKFIKWYQRH